MYQPKGLLFGAKATDCEQRLAETLSLEESAASASQNGVWLLNGVVLDAVETARFGTSLGENPRSDSPCGLSFGKRMKTLQKGANGRCLWFPPSTAID